MEHGRIARPANGWFPRSVSVEAAATVGAGAMLAFQHHLLLGVGEEAAHNTLIGKIAILLEPASRDVCV